MIDRKPRVIPASVRALIVEDERLIALTLEDCLRGIGITNIEMAHSLEGGLRAAWSRRFDIAILDVNLGDGRSDDIADILHKHGTPFLFSTGYGRAGVSSRFSAYPVVTKPCALSEICTVVADLLD